MSLSEGHLEAPSECVATVLFDHQDSIHQAAAAVELLQSQSDVDDGEPPEKRARSEDETFTETITIDWNDDNVKQTLYNVNRALTLRLEELESKYEMLLRTVGILNKKLQQKEDKGGSGRGRGSAVVVGLPQNGSSGQAPLRNAYTAPGSNVTLITLNNEDDYPNGVWLGDENNPEMRVRVPISSSDLLHIHSNCRTPEKMSLTLLDYLFDRDTQAISNLSGTGKHGKKQLDPLKVYAIRCHLIHRFGLSEQEWHRIRLNIDSKCRTAYRRKVKGQSLSVKGFKDTQVHKSVDEYITYTTSDIHGDGQLQIQEGLSLDGSGELQIIHATEEQLAQLQKNNQIHILEDNQVPAELIQQLQVQHNSNSGVVTTTGSGDQIQITYTTGLTDGSSHVVEYDEDGQLQVNDHKIDDDTVGVVQEDTLTS